MAFVYFIAGQLSFLISVDSAIVTLVMFTAEGFALAGVLIYGRHLWFGIFIGQFCLGLSTDLALAPAALTAAVNALEALLAFYLFNRLRLKTSLSRTKDVAGLISLIFLVLQPFSALAGNLVLLSFNVIDISHYFTSTFAWWLGNSMGQLLVAPFLMYAHHHCRSTLPLEFIGNALATLALSYLVLIHFDLKHLALLLTATMPFLIYLAAKRDLHYASFSVIVIAFVAIYSAHLNLGIFSGDDSISAMISLNFYILSQLMLVLLVGTLLAEKQYALKRLNQMALYDQLTGLPNRYLLQDRIQQAIRTTHRNNCLAAVCFIDIDHFKAVNDTLGHEAGDTVLKEITSRIKRSIREDDSLLRIGGDEFVLVLTNIHHQRNVATLLEYIGAEANEPIKIGTQSAHVSLSVGVSLYPQDTDSMCALIANADTAMYEAKHSGKNKFVFYHSENTECPTPSAPGNCSLC